MYVCLVSVVCECRNFYSQNCKHILHYRYIYTIYTQFTSFLSWPTFCSLGTAGLYSVCIFLSHASCGIFFCSHCWPLFIRYFTLIAAYSAPSQDTIGRIRNQTPERISPLRKKSKNSTMPSWHSEPFPILPKVTPSPHYTNSTYLLKERSTTCFPALISIW